MGTTAKIDEGAGLFAMVRAIAAISAGMQQLGQVESQRSDAAHLDKSPAVDQSSHRTLLPRQIAKR